MPFRPGAADDAVRRRRSPTTLTADAGAHRRRRRYGDVLPLSAHTRLAMIVIMLIAATVFTYEISNLVEALRQMPKYAGRFVDRHVWSRCGLGAVRPHPCFLPCF